MADFHDYLYDIVQDIINGNYSISDNAREIASIINNNAALDTIETMLEEHYQEHLPGDDGYHEAESRYQQFIRYNMDILNRLNNNNENITRRVNNIINDNNDNMRPPTPPTSEMPVPEPIEIPQEVLDRIPQEVLNIITCPIGGEIMRNPVVNSVGQTYDRQSIQQWLSRGNRTDPNTRQQITNTLIPNFSIKSLINSYIPQLGGKKKYTKKNRKYKKSKKTKINKRTKNMKKNKKCNKKTKSKRK
tara:strand:+ start:16717 stop:17454 length:738 start_codon:yes stop_codon:yes gene_type:complete